MVLDVTYLILLCWGLYRGGSSGFVRYIFSFLAFLIGIIGALKLTHAVTTLLQNGFGWQSQYLPFITFIILFVGIVILVRLLANFLDQLIRFLYLNIFNRIAGALLGALLFTLLFSLFIWLFNQIGLIDPDMRDRSLTYQFVQPVFPAVMDWTAKIVPFVKSVFEGMQDLFKELTTRSTV